VTSTRNPFPTVAAVALATCGCAPADLGQDPNILWWTDHETGDLTDWDRGGAHWAFTEGTLEIATLPNPTRSGKYSLKSSVKTQAAGTQSAAQALRTGGLPTEAYYSAWYYFPALIINTNYWAFFQYRSRTDAADDTTALNIWDLEVITDSNRAMYLSLYRHAFDSVQVNRWDVTTPSIPVGQWFQVEMFLRATNDSSGRLTVWFNGALIFDVSGQPTMPSSYIEWVVGGGTEVIDPSPAIMFIDDAAVSKRRLGPDFPVFWRGE